MSVPDLAAGATGLARAGGHTAQPESFCRAWNRALAPAYAAAAGAFPRMRADPCRYPNEHPAAVNALLDRTWQAMGDWDWRKDFRRLAVPALVLQGEEGFSLARRPKSGPASETIRSFLDRSFAG